LALLVRMLRDTDWTSALQLRRSDAAFAVLGREDWIKLARVPCDDEECGAVFIGSLGSILRRVGICRLYKPEGACVRLGLLGFEIARFTPVDGQGRPRFAMREAFG